MSHRYNNYAHLEGVVDQQPAFAPTIDGSLLTFTLSVSRKYRDHEGQQMTGHDVFYVEIENATARFAASSVAKGSRVTIDGTLRPQLTNSGMPTILAHRILTLDNSGWLKEIMAHDESLLERHRNVIHQVLDPTAAMGFEWKNRYGSVQQYSNKITGEKLYIDADTYQLCNRKGKAIRRDAAPKSSVETSS